MDIFLFSSSFQLLSKKYETEWSPAESTNKAVNYHSKDITQTQQQRPELPMVTLTWHACKYKVYKLHQRYIPKMRPLLLCLCDIFQALINSLVCVFYKKHTLLTLLSMYKCTKPTLQFYPTECPCDITQVKHQEKLSLL